MVAKEMRFAALLGKVRRYSTANVIAQYTYDGTKQTLARAGRFNRELPWFLVELKSGNLERGR
jgi:ribosomal protein L39E